MKRTLSFAFALVATVALVWLLSTPIPMGDKTLPPLGKFFNPFSGFWQNAEPATGFPYKHPSLNLPGLKGKVQVVYDDLLVPHIFAENTEDAARVQGYVTARNRLWQMDVTVRKSAGKLSEILGERTLNIDRFARRRGMQSAAENTVITWQKDPVTKGILDAYTAGVNAYIDEISPAEYPIEFKLLNYAPTHWSMLCTALVQEGMAETLASNEGDLTSTEALAHFGRPAFDSLYPEWNPKQVPIIPDTGQWKDLKPLLPPVSTEPVSLTGIDQLLDGRLASNDDEGLEGYLKGSNNWAVDGTRSKDGHPLLANDPHLNLTLPSIWYQVQIHTPSMNCYGVSLPGVPGAIIGFNDDIAWGVTNVSHDVADWYKIKWVDAGYTKYEVDGETKEVLKRVEEIKVKGKPSLMDTVRYTIFGPVVYDFDPKHPLRDCAYRWVEREVHHDRIVPGFAALNAGKNYEDYKNAISTFDCPAQNFVFATRSGDIAIQVQGRFPIRAHEQGRFVADGSRWQNTWQDYIPQDEIPSMKNPARGYVFSANQNSTPPSYPYYYLGNFDSFRGRRINSRLEAMHNATVDSMKTMQLDNYSQRAADALPAMLQLLNRAQLDADGRKMADVLASWNYKFDADQIAPTYFDTWWDSCYVKIWDEMEALRKTNIPVNNPEAWRTIELLAQDTLNRFFDHPGTPARETARDIVLESFKSMQDYFHKNPQQNASWGKAKGFVIKHLGQIDAFSRTDVIVGGHKTAPNAISKSNGPSWRMIVDLGSPVHALGVYPGGASGNPGSRYYDNMVDTWAKGDYYDLLLLHDAAEQSPRITGKEVYNPN